MRDCMKIEHTGLQVADPAAMADWYVEHLGFAIKRSADEPNPVRFLADSGGQVMIEIYRNPVADVPDYGSMNPLLLHIAYDCPDVDETVKRLVSAGASIATDAATTPAGDRLAMLRDPWGLSIQSRSRMFQEESPKA